jgi:uncharacterized membrane protein
MELIWIPISILAAMMQAVRTAAQKTLNARLSTWMTTYVRSLFGLPVSIVYLWVVMRYEGLGWPEFDARYLAYCFGAAAVQVIATYLLIWLFQMRNFAVGTMLSKTDVMQAALIGTLLFSEAINAVGWIAIALTIVGVIAISIGRAGLGKLGTGEMSLAQALVAKPTLVGLATGFFFCMSYLFLREASLGLNQGGFLYRAAWTVVIVGTMQGGGRRCLVVGDGAQSVPPPSWRHLALPFHRPNQRHRFDRLVHRDDAGERLVCKGGRPGRGGFHAGDLEPVFPRNNQPLGIVRNSGNRAGCTSVPDLRPHDRI